MLWRSGELKQCVNASAVYFEPGCNFFGLAMAGMVEIVAKGELILVLEETQRLRSEAELEYESTRCVRLATGKLCYHVSRVGMHNLNFSRIVTAWL